MAYLNRTTKQWQEIDTAHHLHPFTDYKSLAKEGSIIITKADGVHLTTSDDKQLLDAMSGLWCVNVGYGRKNLADVAYKQMQELPYYNSFFKTATPPSIELAKELAEISPHDLNHAFFSSSGSEANDTVVRMVRRYWDLKGKPNKKTFLSREYAYHGSTMTGMSLGGMTAMHAQGDMMPGFEHVLPPYWYKYGSDMSHDDFGIHAANKIEEKINEIGPDNIAAFIGEPIQGLEELSFHLIPIGQEFKKFVKNMTFFLLLMKSFVDSVELETGLDQILIILNLTLLLWPKGLPQDISHCLES